MLIGLAGNPLKKNLGLLKQDSTRTGHNSQRKTSELGPVGYWYCRGLVWNEERSLSARHSISGSGAHSGSQAVLHFRQNTLGCLARIGVSRYGTTDNEIIRPHNDRFSRSDPSLLVVGEEALWPDTRRHYEQLVANQLPNLTCFLARRYHAVAARS